MRRKNSFRLQFDSLENRALLTAVPLYPEVPGGGSSTPTSTADTQAMQQDASANNLELLLAQTDMLLGTNPNVSQYAALLLRDHTEAGYQLQTLASSQGVVLPAGPVSGDQSLAGSALEMMLTQGSANVDHTFLTLMVQNHQQAIATFTQQLSATSDPGFHSFLATQLPVLQLHLSLAESLLSGPTAINPSTPPAAGPQTLSSSDAQILSTSFSSGWLERYMSEVTSAIASGQSQSQYQSAIATLQPFANKVINDHAQSMFQLQGIAAATNTPISAGLQPGDAQLATQFLSSLNLGNLPQAELAYLTTTISTNQQSISQTQSALGTVSNSSLAQLLMNDLASNTLHVVGAQSIASTLEYALPQGDHAREVVAHTRGSSAACRPGPRFIIM